MANLNGIDTASYQAGLDPRKVPMDFNIVKATQGVAYINPDFTRMAKATVDAGKLIGIYHYAEGKDAKAEADFFLRTIPGYIGKAVLALDWEGWQNPTFGTGRDVTWCKAFCDRVYEKTGVRCFIYMSKSVCHAHDWKAVARDYPLWCAQYASMSRTGYQAKPWTDSTGFGAWDKPTIYQYSSGGQLAGWSGRLDLDIAYLTPDQWKAWAKGKPKKEVVVLYPEKSDADLAVEILFDVHGTGDKRKKALAGRYDGAQADVDKLLSGNKTSLLMAIQQYLKRHGTDKLI